MELQKTFGEKYGVYFKVKDFLGQKCSISVCVMCGECRTYIQVYVCHLDTSSNIEASTDLLDHLLVI